LPKRAPCHIGWRGALHPAGPAARLSARRRDRAGRTLGSHRGIIDYTVGQRRCIGLAQAEPLYVLAIDAERNAVVIGPREALESAGLLTTRVNCLATRQRYQH
jgi:tRNA U34 2-thiouridine synthase MnmA/TrmU